VDCYCFVVLKKVLPMLSRLVVSFPGIDGANENFADAFDLMEDICCALSTNGKMSILIPDFDSSLMEGIFSYNVALELNKGSG
jgi:hypothetical protein